jgi:hypothetical protein
MPSIFVLDVPEFAALIAKAQQDAGMIISGPSSGYWKITGNEQLAFKRTELGFKPAVWYGALTAGMIGSIKRFDRDELVIVDEGASTLENGIAA